jgi:hypothetical protein
MHRVGGDDNRLDVVAVPKLDPQGALQQPADLWVIEAERLAEQQHERDHGRAVGVRRTAAPLEKPFQPAPESHNNGSRPDGHQPRHGVAGTLDPTAADERHCE